MIHRPRLARQMALMMAPLLLGGVLGQAMAHGGAEASSYASCADIAARTATLNGECCDEESEDCSSGRPSTCNIGCARVLLPYFDDCAAALGVDAAAQFADVVALCHATVEASAPMVAVSYTVGGTPGSTPGANQIFTVHADGSNPRQLTHCAAGCVQPDWSPDGSQIVFGEQSQSGMQLRLIAPDGSGLTELTEAPGYVNMLATWINNTHIVWARQHGGGSVYIGRCLAAGQRDDIFASQLFVMDTRDRSMAPLFKAGTRANDVADTMPSVSPDGKRVAFVTNHTQGVGAGVARVWVADITGANARPISPGRTSVDLQGDGCMTPISQKVPAWSPDGTQIAHWEGVEMNYLAAFSCKPGSQAKCRHDPQRDALITQGNLALGGDYVGWKVWTVTIDGTEGTAAAKKIDQVRVRFHPVSLNQPSLRK